MTDRELTVTECAVLGLLSMGEASGYDLMKRAERSVGFIWRPVKSHLYKLLREFVALGLAEQRAVRQETRPDKVVYRVTDKGREVLRASLVDLKPEGRSALAIFNLKVFFGEIVGAEHVRETIEARRRFVLEHEAALRQIEPTVDPVEDFFPLLTLQLAVDHDRAFVRWADRVLAQLEEHAAAAGGTAGHTTAE